MSRQKKKDSQTDWDGIQRLERRGTEKWEQRERKRMTQEPEKESDRE